MKSLLLFLSIFTLIYANEAEDIIKKVDNNMRGQSVYIKMTMTVKSLRHKRTIKMQTWTKGKDKSFVKITYPPRDKGITFLSLGNEMWQYIPKIERTIKIPPSMMLQNWMGSDISNDDMVKQSSIVDDYDAKVIKKDGSLVTIELIPHEDAAVVWGKIQSTIDTTHFTNVKDLFFDEDGYEVRTFSYDKVKKFGKYYMPTLWSIKPTNKKNNITTLILEDVSYDSKISAQYFKKSALKRFSR